MTVNNIKKIIELNPMKRVNVKINAQHNLYEENFAMKRMYEIAQFRINANLPIVFTLDSILK